MKMPEQTNVLPLVSIIVIALLFVVVLPFAYIWALNTLFPILAIEYTFVNWIAIGLLSSIFWNPTYSKLK